MMKVAILGSGSLGLLWGARMQPLFGESLHLLTRTREQAEFLNREGIRFTDLYGKTEQRVCRARWSERVADGKIDVLLVMVKQTHLPSVIPVIQKGTHRESQIIFWQNGWGHQERIAKLADRPWTYLAVTTEGALKEGPNAISHTGGGETAIGLYPPASKQPHPLFLCWMRMLMEKYGPLIQYDRQILHKIWEKLAVNCVINPLTALYQVKNGALLSPEYEGEWKEVLSEVVLVADQEGISLSYSEINEKVKSVCEKTAGNLSSMLQDLMRGQKTEVDFINGAIVRLGQKHRVNTPANSRLVSLIHEKEKHML
jgi:2-dehydropantoate 2-reductase